MAEIAENPIQETPTQVNYFDPSAWKEIPTAVAANIPAPPVVESKDPVIEEKDKQIEQEKPTSDKPNEPEKIPSATPEPVQDRPKTNIPDAPLKFANEESEKVFNFLKDGKLDEVYSVLSEQKKLAEVDKLAPSDIIKLNLQYQNKDFSPQDINDLFEETYSYPEKPEQRIDELDEEFAKREDKYKASVEKIDNRIKRDAKPATAELQKRQKEIVLPDTQRQAPVSTEPTQEELEVQKQVTERYVKAVDEGLQNFNGYKTTFKDEEVEMDVTYKLSKEEKSKMKPLLDLAYDNAPEFLKSIGWLNEKNELNASKLMQDLPLILNKEGVIQKIVEDSATKRYAESKKALKNVDITTGKQTNGSIGQSSEQLQTSMANHFFTH